LGYIIPVLREKFKDSKIIVLHIDDKTQSAENQASSTPNISILHGTETQTVQKFLEKEIFSIDASLIRIIEWRPSLQFYGDTCLKLLSLVVEFIKQMDAEKRTVSAFGRRWIKNFFKNLTNVNHPLLYRQTDIPVIITGSGPSLETALPLIKKMQDKCLILAASSSVMALLRGGINADLIIATDGGSWALRHIVPFFRAASTAVKDCAAAKSCAAAEGCAFAVNLSAALPSQCGNTPHLLLNDGSFWQSVILHELGLPSVIIPQRGTVTATAIELALVLTTGNIYLAGMDLCVRDIRSHVRPYGFDYIFTERASRFTPVYSQYFFRSGKIQSGGTLGIYAAWFKSQLTSYPQRIYSLGTASYGSKSNRINSAFAGFPEITDTTVLSGLNTTKKKSGIFTASDSDFTPVLYRKRGRDALINAVNRGEFADNLKAELVPLLFPGEKNITEKQLELAIREVSFE
jgi:hypothetical protein